MKKFTADTFTRYQFPSNPRISPDGKYTAFVVQWVDVEKNSYPGDIWVVCNETGSVRRLTAQGDAVSFAWTPDGKIVFPARRGKAYDKAKKEGRLLTPYYIIDPQGGEAVELCALPIEGGAPRILEDGRWLVTGKVDLNRPDFAAMPEGERKAALAEYENPNYRVFEELPWWANGQGDVSRRRSALYICDPADASAKKVTGEYFNVVGVAHAYGRVVYTGVDFKDVMPVCEGLYVLDTKTGESRRLIEQDQYYMGEPWLMDENTVIITLNKKDAHPYAHRDIYLVDVESGEVKKLLDYDRYVGYSPVNSDARLGGGITAKAENGRLYFVTSEDENCHIRYIDKQGNVSAFLTQPGSADSFDIRDGKIVLCAMRGDKLCEIYALESDGAERCLTHFNDWVGEEYAVSTPQQVRFTASDGFEIQGWVMEPAGYEKGKKYPAILHIHGGPRTAFGTVFHNEMQLWASRGYFVLFCNPRGSDGRGWEFADLLDRFGSVDYQNLMDFTDECLKRYTDIDADRVGVTGGSYGGYMTNWIIGHTDRFKAACAQRSIANWLSFEGTTDIGYTFNLEQHGTSLEENPARLWELSPLKYACNAKTPTLFIHADQDYRCYMVECMQMFTALKMHGVDSRIVLFHGENHELSRSGRPQQRIRRMEEIAGWMDKYLKG